MNETNSTGTKFFGQHRTVSSRIVGGLFFLVLLFTKSRWPQNSLAKTLLPLAGLLLVVFGTAGRLWATLYICGYKNTQLIAEGPYSITRNPLYFFSLVGALGVAAATETFAAVGVVALLFGLYYPAVILAEERKLRQIYGAEFEAYCQRVPRFFPRLSLLREPEFYSFNTRLYRKAFFDGIWFIYGYALLQVLEHLHEGRWLPAVVRLY